MTDRRSPSDPPQVVPADSRRPAAGIYMESTRNERLSLLPSDATQVKEVMTSKVTTATPRTSLTEAAGLMKKLDVPVVLVYDGGRLKGMLTERDLGLNSQIQQAPPDAAIERFMHRSIPSCFDDDLVKDAVHVMRASKLEWLPVLDHRLRLVGVLSAYAAER